MAFLSRPSHGRALVLSMAAALSVVAPAGAAATAAAQAAPSKPAPAAPTPPKGGDPVNADARALAAFEVRLKEYVALHKKLEDTLPTLKKESTPQEIDKHQRALAQLVRDARKGAKPGDIFTPASQIVIRKLMTRVFGGPDGKALRASIMDENPGVMKLTANSRYPDTVPLSTVPPQVLQGLPALDEEMEYRFIGDRLILMDVHAHLIADLIENALPR